MAEDKKTGRSEQSKTLKMLKKEMESSKDGEAMRAELKAQGKSRKEIAVEFAKIAMMQKKTIDEEEAHRQKDRKDKDKREEKYHDRLLEIAKEKEASGMSKEAAKEIASIVADGEERNFQKQEDIREKRIEREKTFTGRLVNKAMMKIPQSVGGDKEKQIEEKRERKGFFKSLKGMFSKKEGKDEKGGFIGKMLKTVKKVFKMIAGNFLMIGALVVGMIAMMDIEQLKAVWEGLKKAFTAIWEFLKPIVTTIGEWIKDTAIPALVDYFVQLFKDIGELFSKLTERFKGFTEMSWVDRMWAILGAFKDIGGFLGDLIGNFAKTVEKMFGGDGTWITGIWESITGFFNGIWEWIKLLFTDPVTALDQMIMGTASMLTDFAGWLYDTMLVPLIDWFKSMFDFSSISGILATLINLTTMIPNLIKEFLLDPAVKWIGDVFGFDTSSFTEFSIGELVMKGVNKAVGWLEEKFDFKMPDWDIVGKMKGIVKSMIGGLPDMLVPDSILKWANAKAPVKAEKPPEPPKPGQLKKSQWAQREKAEWARKTGGNEADWTKAMGGKGKVKEMYGSYKSGDMAEPSKMATSKSELDQIKKDEGFREGVYEDTVGIKTIGYGFNLERQGSQEALDAAGIKKTLADLKGGKANLTEEEASRLMQGEMGHFKGVAERYVGSDVWKTLSANRQGILTNMAYNMGEGGLGQFSNLRKAIQKGDWKQAQKEMASSKWAGQVKGRADRLVARMGGTEKSNDLNSVQMANNTAKDSKGRPIMVTPMNVGGNTTLNKGGDNYQVAGNASDPNDPQKSSRQGRA